MKLSSNNIFPLLALAGSTQFLSAHAVYLPDNTQDLSGPAEDVTRFSKFYDPKEVTLATSSVQKVEYPLNEEDANRLRKETQSVSVLLDDEECAKTTKLDQVKNDLKAKGLYPPPQPETDETFWEKFAEVVNAQSHLKAKQKNPCMTDPLPIVMPAMTELWKGFDIVDVAEAVHDEFPGIYHNQMIANWIAQGKVKYNNAVIERKSTPDFLRGPVMLSEMIGRAIRLVGPCDFTLKWIVGRARPEEIAWRIHCNTISKEKESGNNIPNQEQQVKGRKYLVPNQEQDKRRKYIPSTECRGKESVIIPKKFVEEDMREYITNSIAEMNLETAPDFTAYPEGSPRHPSWPAMHSAASAASFWLDIVLDLDEEQLCEARMLDYSISFARTVAGVHYTDDNIAGLMVGQSILAQRLPAILNAEYGSNIDVVKERMEEKGQYDWTMFEESDCYKEARFNTVPAPKPAYCFDKRNIPDVTSNKPTISQIDRQSVDAQTFQITNLSTENGSDSKVVEDSGMKGDDQVDTPDAVTSNDSNNSQGSEGSKHSKKSKKSKKPKKSARVMEL